MKLERGDFGKMFKDTGDSEEIMRIVLKVADYMSVDIWNLGFMLPHVFA